MPQLKKLKQIPHTYDKKVINAWVGDGEVEREILHESNYCLLVKHDGNAVGGNKGLNLVTKRQPITYRLIRFFLGKGDRTQVSLDWEGTSEQAVDKMVELMCKELDF